MRFSLSMPRNAFISSLVTGFQFLLCLLGLAAAYWSRYLSLSQPCPTFRQETFDQNRPLSRYLDYLRTFELAKVVAQ